MQNVLKWKNMCFDEKFAKYFHVDMFLCFRLFWIFWYAYKKKKKKKYAFPYRKV